MIYQKNINGTHITMKSVDCDDAEFILRLRLDEKIKPFISPTENSIEKQIDWIKQQKERNGDYYFLYTNKENIPLGVIGVYGIIRGVGETGRQMSFGDSISNMEAEYLLMCFAFETLKLDRVVSTIYKTNKKAISKGRKLGICFDKSVLVNDIDSYYVEVSAKDFRETWKPKMESFLSKVEYLNTL